jgi:HSP20 family protein
MNPIGPGENMKKRLGKEWMTVYRTPAYRQHVQSLFDELIHKTWGRTEWAPPATVTETDENFIIELDVPGVDEQSIRVLCHEKMIGVEGRRQLPQESGKVFVHLSERPKGKFARIFDFAEPLDTENVQQSYHKGVLTLTIPKRRAAKEGRSGKIIIPIE